MDVVGLGSVIAIDAGNAHTCALTSEGRLKCWGANGNGRLGDGTTDNRTTPVDVSGLSVAVASISLGGAHTCAVTDDTGVLCWGANSHGQLGTATTEMCFTNLPCSTIPVLVMTAAVDTDGDGCSDKAELGMDAARGSLSNYKNPWDFYDVEGFMGGPPDQFIDLSPLARNAGSPEECRSPEPEYDVHYDRGPQVGLNPWNMGPPDGVIDLANDILGVILQYHHDCR